MATRKIKYPILYVEWWDHYSGGFHPDGWNKLGDEDMTGWKCKTVGFLLREDKDKICLGITLGDEHFSGGRWYILKSDIIKRKRLKP